MSRFKLPLLLLAIVFLECHLVFGQARSPFSAVGFGDTNGDALANSQGMAGAGVGNPQIWFLNNQNPALLVNNRITVFQAGIVGENKRIYSDTIKGNTRDGNLNYLVLGFPVMRDKNTRQVRWATNLGLMPYSSVNYDTKTIDSVNGFQVTEFDRAEGGFNQFYWSNGVRINKYLNVGLKMATYFSSIISDYSNVLNDPNQVYKYVPNVHEALSIKGFRFTPAMSFQKDSIKNKYTFNFGLTYDLQSNLSATLQQVLERKDYFTGSILEVDTTVNKSIKIKFPQRIIAGVSFGRPDKWVIASDFAFTSLGTSTIKVGTDERPVQNGWRLCLGGEFTPDVRSLGSYFKRVTYRAGASAEESMYLVNGNPIKDFGINFGFSFPVNRYSSVDVAFRSGRRGDKKTNGIEENYFKLYFGVTFNDQWFIKRRFD